MKIFNWFKASEYAIVGRNIKWKEINNEVLRIIDFDSNETIIDNYGNVIAKSKFKPYGFLIVEWPIIERLVKLPIVHQDDFLLASIIFNDKAFQEQKKIFEFLATYAPKENDRNAPFLHVFHFLKTAPKTLEKYYETKKRFIINPEIIFGQLKWEGQLQVQINMNPDFNLKKTQYT